MQNASKAYKQSIKGIGRNREYIKATIGVINSEAQKNVALDDVTEVTYFSNKRKPFDHYTVDNVYAMKILQKSMVSCTFYQKKTLDMSFIITELFL